MQWWKDDNLFRDNPQTEDKVEFKQKQHDY